MKYYISFLVLNALIFMTTSCQENRNIENKFSSLNDTISIKTKKIKGRGLFELGYGSLKFKDTSETFSNSIKYPKNIENIKRYQLKVDFSEKQNNNVEILLGNKNGNQVFIVDQNNNKDLTDDIVRMCENIIWTAPPEIIKCEYLISNGKEMVKDSSWLCIGKGNGKILLGKREYFLGKFSIDNENYEIGVIEPRNSMSFAYNFLPEIALLSKFGVNKDSLSYSDLIKIGEILILNDKHYRFEKISNNGDLVTLVKEERFDNKIGTQKGMIAPEFKAITISGDTITNSIFGKKLTVIANSCGCGGDKKSTEDFYEMERLYGNDINVLHVDFNIKKTNTGIHIDSEKEFNKDFSNHYRQEYCSRICYVIGKNKRIIDKFNINQWKDRLSTIINKN
ncbi:hypothetical protein [Seonamhaeicola sp. ML3]|uniref:hypothetical protein n=1 Tax=Seonamhaeicola sp. ML3 TaxID=2937786 RepID=UPI0020102449|nr:hypothetical protein [Seonamhaeicola sp. ML3]